MFDFCRPLLVIALCVSPTTDFFTVSFLSRRSCPLPCPLFFHFGVFLSLGVVAHGFVLAIHL